MTALNCWALSVGDGTANTATGADARWTLVEALQSGQIADDDGSGSTATAADATQPAVPNERGIPSAPQDRQRGKTRTVESPADV